MLLKILHPTNNITTHLQPYHPPQTRSQLETLPSILHFIHTSTAHLQLYKMLTTLHPPNNITPHLQPYHPPQTLQPTYSSS